jgi:beta-xylosidase
MSKIRSVVRLTLRASGLALIAALVLIVAAPLGGDEPEATVQPAPTATPTAPGIAVATANFDLPDPFLLDDDGTYYLYLSSAFGNPQNVPVLTGEPGHWSITSVDAVPQLPAWALGDPSANESTWSPSVYKLDGTYVMYLAPGLRGSAPPQHCIAIATSPSPTGPFRVDASPFICQRKLGGDIDPQLFIDPHGPDGPSRPNYLVWKSDNNSTPGDGVPTIWAQPISNDGLHLTGQPVSIFMPDQRWQMSLVEAPQMALAPNSAVWLFFSGGMGYFSPDYAMSAVHCKGPLGPCTEPLPEPLIATNAQGSGPGEETYFVGPDGSDWLLYSPVHTGDGFEVYRPIEAARIGWGDAGPFVATAGTFPPANIKSE